MSIVPKLIYRFKANLIKPQAAIFAEIEKLNIKFIWKFKGYRINKIILKKKKEKLEDSHFPIQTYWETKIIKTMWVWYKDRYMNQENRI